MDKCQMQLLYYFEWYMNNPNMYLWCIKLSTVSEQKNDFIWLVFFVQLGNFYYFQVWLLFSIGVFMGVKVFIQFYFISILYIDELFWL
jgi:hypothetical protein